MSPELAIIEVRELTTLEVVGSIAAYFASLAAEVRRGAEGSGKAEVACAVAYGKTCLTMAARLRSAAREYDVAVLAHLNSDCTGH